MKKAQLNKKDALSGKELRKDRRKLERQESKVRTVRLVPNFIGHDSSVRTHKKQMCLFITNLNRTIEKEEAFLTHSNKKPPPKPPSSGLKGPARPAWEVYPELYPEMYPKFVEEEKIDLIANFSPHCFAHGETRNLVVLYFQLGFAHLLQKEISLAQKAFKRSLELESDDPFGCRIGLLFASNQPQHLFPVENPRSDLLYHMAAIKQTKEAVLTAVDSCPEFAMALLNHTLLNKMIDVEKIVGWIREQREKWEEVEGTDNLMLLSRSDAGLCTNNEPAAMAVCYFALYSHLWIKNKQLMEWLKESMAVMEVVQNDDDVEKESEESESNEEEEEGKPRYRSRETLLVNMFEEAMDKSGG